MNNINRFAPAVKVPGLLTDEALQEQLKQFRDQQNATQRNAPMPSSAVDAAPQVMRQFVDNPISRTLRATSALSPGPLKGLMSLGGAAAGMREPSAETVKNAERNRLIQERSDIAANSPSGAIGLGLLTGPIGLGLSDLSPLARAGALSPEESQEASEQRLQEAQRAEGAIRDKARVREQLRGLTDEQAQQLGIPTGPLDQQTMREERDRQQSLDAERVRAAQQTTEQAEAAVADPDLQVKQAQWLNILRSGYKGLTGVVTSSLKYPAAILETAIGSETAESTRTWIDTAEATLEKMMPADKARSQDFMTELAAGGGSMVGFMTLGYLAATIGLPGTATTAALGAAVGGMEQFEDAERFNAPAVTKLYSLMLGSGMGLSEALPINRMLFRAEHATGGLVSRMLTNTAAGSMEEFLQEFGQAAGQDIVAKWLYDEQRELDASEWFRQGAIGGITGGLAGAATSTLHESGVLPANPVRDRAMENQLPPAEQERIVEAFIVDAQRQIDEILTPTETTETATAVEPEVIQAQRTPRVPPVEYVPETAQEVEQQAAAASETAETAQAVETTETAEAVETTETAQAVEPEVARAADAPATRNDFLQASPETFQRPGWAVVTATRESFGPWNMAENVAANERLRRRLERMGIEYLQADGAYQGEAQGPSFVVMMDEAQAIELGAELGQESILTNRGLVYTDGSGRVVPSVPEQTVIGPEARDADFYSTLPDGTSFTMGLNFDATTSAAADPVIAEQVEAVQVPTEELQPLKGLKTGKPVETVVKAARAYAASRGLPVRRQAEYVKADPDRGRRIAEAYEAMEHAPDDPAVQAAYQAMIDETLAQYQFVKASGLQIEAIEEGQADPYPEGPKQVLEDLERGHLWFFPTDQGFGTQTEITDNPLLAPTDEYINGRQLLANDVFRIVHDFFGHGIEGSGFGARGEENAWQSHMRLYSEAALPAVTSETRGQNSWVNFGPHGEANRANQRETVYADQKTGIMPAWTWQEGVADEFSRPAETVAEGETDLLAQTSRGRGRLRAEQQRAAQGTPGAADPAQDTISIGNIAKNFARALDLTARQGRFTLKGKGIVGQYSTRQDVIRLKSWNDLSTLVHEAGHSIEANAGPELKAFIKQNEALFKDAARRLYGGYEASMPEPTKVAEGFAEFFRIYVLNRQHAEKKFSTLTTGLDTVLDQTSPELKQTLELTGQQFAAWLQLPSAQIVRNMVVSGIQTEGINAAMQEINEQGFPTWFREVYARTIETTVNRYTQLDRMVSDLLNQGQRQAGQSIDLKRADDPSTLIRLATNTGARAMVQATDGVMGYRSTDPTTKGLREALLRYHGLGPDQNLRRIDPERQRDFAAYLITLRGMDEYRRFAEGKIDRPPLNATLADLRIAAREFEQRYGQDFKDAAQMVHDYGMGLWQKSFDAGLISKETYKDGLDRQFYVPLQREMDDRPLTTGEMTSAVGQGRSVVRRFKGSDRNVIDPMDVLMHKTFALERVIAENDVKKALATLADRVGQAGSLVERIPAHKLLGTEYSVRDIARQLTRDPSVTEADAADLMTILESSIEDGNRIALFRSQQAAVAGDNIVFFWEKGKLAAIQIKDGDVGADIVNTLNGIGRETMPLFMDTVANISTGFRTAITSWPDFLLVNFIRDQVSAWILTDVGYIPFVSGLRGVGDEVRQTQWARQYNAAMGMMGGMNVASLHEARVNRDISTLRGKGYLVRAFQGSGVRGIGQGLSRVVEVTETGSRLGIFRSAYERGKAEGLTDWEASVEASYMATDYANFGLNGSRMLAWRRTIPFLNAQLQGYYKMLRTMGGDEARRRKGLMFSLKAYFKNVNGMDLSRTEKQALRTGRKAWMKMASIGFIGAALTFMLQDDPDYQEASEYLRATGWVIPTGDGELLYIPKPFELAFLSNIFERAFESASGDTEAKSRLLRGFGMTMMPPVQSPLARVITEQAANFNFFMDREIVPDYMRALSPELQYNHYTSSFAKELGALMGWSPMRIDHVMSGMFASAYRDISSMYNWTDPNRPTPDATDMPITRRFVRDVRRGSASSRDFWSYASTVDGTLRRAELSYRRHIDEGREDVAEAYLRELDADEHAYAVLGAHFNADAKRLHPMYRARQISTVISAVRREMVTEIGLESTESKFSEPIKLTAREKAEADEILSEYARREVRNTLIYMQAPGWANKAPLPLDPTADLLLRTTPAVAEELERRLRKAKVYDAEVVRDYWPDVRDRLITDGQDAFLSDVLAVAKVTVP